jgi:hypothetical protein
MEAQGKSQIYLESDMESFLVHVIAKTLEKTNIWEEPVAIRMLAAQNLAGLKKARYMQDIGEECLFINGWEIKKPQWPSQNYFVQMGEIAFGMASISTNPASHLLELASNNFQTMSAVLRTAQNLMLNKI